MEDRAPGYKDFSTKYCNLNEMETPWWPAPSPDLTLIENLKLDMGNQLGETWGQIGPMSNLECTLNAV